ncbi:MAG: phenylalanine--tRNA ligase subunit beta [Candidatus Levybacteria bacterium]|nr:phenylalanine--tRNA ligase subunit beta [Candidatus Levybacteria bacterium]
MNIKILDSWLRDHLKTKATPLEIAEKLSLTSVSIERTEDYKNDKLYDIEVTTNRPDLMSVVGLARETSAILPQFNIAATFIPFRHSGERSDSRIPSTSLRAGDSGQARMTIINDPKLVNRVCAVVMEVKVKPSPKEITERLETSGIRSLNNLIDVTNYVMRTIGHPAHVFDFDRLESDKLIIRESKKGERIVTLDGKDHILPGGDIVAENGKGEIVDLLGVMGLANSVVTDQTRRILFFIDNNNPIRMRKTSMSLAIRSEAVQMNEKGVDPELAMDALQYGISLYKKIADGEVISEIIDIYPNKPKTTKISVSEEKINTIIGVQIPLKTAAKILSDLGFQVNTQGRTLSAIVPSYRIQDILLEEDIIEEIARVYGYHNLPSTLPAIGKTEPVHLSENPFFWEERVKEALKYWGFTECYTYSMVSEDKYEGPITEAVKLRNPLDEDRVYMRNSLVPSLLQVTVENRNRKQIKLFEIANVYAKKTNDLPFEQRMLAGVIKKDHASFYEIKGVIEQLFNELGITEYTFKKLSKGGIGADLYIAKKMVGEIEILDDNLIDFEIDFDALLKHVTLRKTYTPINKYPPIIEDIAFIVAEDILTGDMIGTIKEQNPLIKDVSLLDKYQNVRTFHIVYQDPEKNLTSSEIAPIREKLLMKLQTKYHASLKK